MLIPCLDRRFTVLAAYLGRKHSFWTTQRLIINKTHSEIWDSAGGRRLNKMQNCSKGKAMEGYPKKVAVRAARLPNLSFLVLQTLSCCQLLPNELFTHQLSITFNDEVPLISGYTSLHFHLEAFSPSLRSDQDSFCTLTHH